MRSGCTRRDSGTKRAGYQVGGLPVGAWRIHLWLGEAEKRWECEGRGGVVGKERWSSTAG